MQTSAKLTPCERVNRCLSHLDHDRFPRHEIFWDETLVRWEKEGLVGGEAEVLNLLEGDFHRMCWIWLHAFPGQVEVIEENPETRIVRDENGALLRLWQGRSGTPEHLGFDCDSPEKWEKKYKPALLNGALEIDVEAVRQSYITGRKLGRWNHFMGIEFFEQTRQMLGDETSLMAMLEEPEWIIDIATIFTDVLIRNLDACMATGIEPDGLFLCGDIAYKNATMCSPQTYKDLFWPQLKRMVEWAHTHGMKFIYHSDGDVNSMIDLFLEAGVEALHPLECKANMDVRKLLPKYADRLSFLGNIDIMKMITNDLNVIEEEIISKFSVAKSTKGYIYHSDHSVPPQVSWKTYQAIIDMVKKHGNY